MKEVFVILKEQVQHLNLIFRLASYDIKSKYESHYLGAAWQFLNPALQILIYWFVFGMGLRGGQPIDGVPFIIWLLTGLIPWFFISPTIIQASNSVYSKVTMVSKMKFPVSILPSITIISNALNFLFMMLILGLIFIIYGVNPGIYLLQLPYYLFSLLVFLFAITLLFSTLSTIIRDVQMVIQSLMRMMMYLTPVVWNMENLPHLFLNILKLNPLFYLIDGFRKTFLSQFWFFQDWVYMVYFWVTTLILLFLGAIIHLKFKKQFVDFV